MADRLTPQQRHHIMSSIHASSTKPELRLRKELWERGYRYRINDKRFAGTPDIVLPKYRTAIFVHGCFWHGHKGCKNYVIPKTNTSFWVEKITRNQKRDEDVWRKLEAKGWYVVVIWECELKKGVIESTIERIQKTLYANREAFLRHKVERAANRQQRMLERKEQKRRTNELLLELSKI